MPREWTEMRWLHERDPMSYFDPVHEIRCKPGRGCHRLPNKDGGT